MQSKTPRIGRRSGVNIFRGKQIRVHKGRDVFEDYWTTSSSDSSMNQDTISLVKKSKKIHLDKDVHHDVSDKDKGIKRTTESTEIQNSSNIKYPQNQSTHKQKNVQESVNSKNKSDHSKHNDASSSDSSMRYQHTRSRKEVQKASTISAVKKYVIKGTKRTAESTEINQDSSKIKYPQSQSTHKQKNVQESVNSKNEIDHSKHSDDTSSSDSSMSYQLTRSRKDVQKSNNISAVIVTPVKKRQKWFAKNVPLGVSDMYKGSKRTTESTEINQDKPIQNSSKVKYKKKSVQESNNFENNESDHSKHSGDTSSSDLSMSYLHTRSKKDVQEASSTTPVKKLETCVTKDVQHVSNEYKGTKRTTHSSEINRDKSIQNSSKIKYPQSQSTHKESVQEFNDSKNAVSHYSKLSDGIRSLNSPTKSGIESCSEKRTADINEKFVSNKKLSSLADHFKHSNEEVVQKKPKVGKNKLVSDKLQHLRRSKRNAGPPLDIWRNEYKRWWYDPKNNDYFLLGVDKGTKLDDYGIKTIRKKQEYYKSKKAAEKCKKHSGSKIEVKDGSRLVKLSLDRPFSSLSWISDNDENPAYKTAESYRSHFGTHKFGFLNILPNQTKPCQNCPSKNTHFVVVNGTVEVTIHKTIRHYGRCDSFFVPSNVDFMIKNTGRINSLLSYSISKNAFFNYSIH